MEVKERKNEMRNALINSFVEDYKSYKNTVKAINKDLKKSKIDYKYTYDEFCADFLNQTLETIEIVDIFDSTEFSQFYVNFWQFNLYNLQCMIDKKLTSMGYKFEDFYNDSIIKKNEINNRLK